jgi:hypothetical protein
MDLKSTNNKITRKILLDKLFTVYKLEFEGAKDKMKKIADRAMCIMVKPLSMWRNMANKNRNKDFNTYVLTRWPQIQEEDWNLFVAYDSEDEFKKLSEWGKGMREKNKMNHRLGSRGYTGKKKVWEKEDIVETKAGRQPPLSYIRSGC